MFSMLTRLRIQNFRLCKDVDIDQLGPVVALVGRNGAGKSNILQAISAISRMATSSDAIGFPDTTLGLNRNRPFSETLEFSIDGASYRYEISIGFSPRVGPLRP